MTHVLIPAHLDATPPPLGGVVHALHGQTMGTTWSVKLVGHHSAAPALWHRAVQQTLDAVVAQMSPWEPGSNISRFNRAAPHSWHTLPEAFAQVLQHGLDVAARSGGAYDPTSGALVNAWGFGPVPRAAGQSVPSAQAIEQARAACGWQRLNSEPTTRRVQQPGGLQLDLSAIAKGFGVDHVAHCLRAHGVQSFLVEVGGELRGEGVKPDGQPWWVSLEPPSADCPLPATRLALHGLSVATSGDYRRYLEHDGQRYSHTVDPRSGWPVRHALASVSVLHRECMAADAWSTALMVLGLREGLALADAHGLVARFVARGPQGWAEHFSAPMQALML
jgi:FAD:protein FMN transferase